MGRAVQGWDRAICSFWASLCPRNRAAAGRAQSVGEERAHTHTRLIVSAAKRAAILRLMLNDPESGRRKAEGKQRQQLRVELAQPTPQTAAALRGRGKKNSSGMSSISWCKNRSGQRTEPVPSQPALTAAVLRLLSTRRWGWGQHQQDPTVLGNQPRAVTRTPAALQRGLLLFEFIVDSVALDGTRRGGGKQIRSAGKRAQQRSLQAQLPKKRNCRRGKHGRALEIGTALQRM